MEKEQLRSLFESMTWLEKLGQLTQTTGQHYVADMPEEMVETGPEMDGIGLNPVTLPMVGSVLGVSGAEATNKIQHQNLSQNRLKIPLLFMHDAIHGYITIYPVPLGLSCSFDNSLLFDVAQATARELRAAGIHVNFSPMADLVRDARWGRVVESFGEDRLVSGGLGQAMIQGYQGLEQGKIGPHNVAACLKHFAAYGAPLAGKDYASVDVSMREFFASYAKPYEIALQANPKLVMSSFNSLNGEAVTASNYILTHVLREKFGFPGLVISDWGAVAELKNHGVAQSDRECAELALTAGVDIEMVSSTYLAYGPELLQADAELQEKVNAAVWKVLELKNEFGLFETPYADAEAEKMTIMQHNHLELAEQAALQSCVLLKNNGALPISVQAQKILLLGEFAQTQELLGAWQCKGRFEDTVSLLQGMKKEFPHAEVHACATLEECQNSWLEDVDMIVVTIGETWNRSGEGHSTVAADMPDKHKDLLRKVQGLGKPYAAVAFSGRPLALGDCIETMPALLWCWYPGTRGGSAIARLLSGAATPSGRLTMSFPRHAGNVPVYYNEPRSGRPACESSYSSRYQDCEIGPLFPFGHGLSYADITYSKVVLSANTITKSAPVQLQFCITNNSNYTCKEPVLLFMHDVAARMVRPDRELIAYRCIELKPYEQKTVIWEINWGQLCYLNASLEPVLEPGPVKLFLNGLDNEIGSIECC